jgi:RNA polymerase sigma-70 factor (ECF subfamily)
MEMGRECHKRVGLTDEELALSVQRGSKVCFAELARRFGPRLYGYFRQKLDSREDCEDLVQDTLLKAFTNIHRFRGKWAFTTWIFTIGTRRLVDHFRADGLRTKERIGAENVPQPGPLEKAAQREETENLWRLARELPGKQYHALWLRYVEELPVKEIARALSVPRMQVKVLLFRARARLFHLERRMRSAVKSGTRGETRRNVLKCCRGTKS